MDPNNPVWVVVYPEKEKNKQEDKKKRKVFRKKVKNLKFRSSYVNQNYGKKVPNW
jgi:hypothetical protein